jgi:hypothetical protein
MTDNNIQAQAAATAPACLAEVTALMRRALTERWSFFEFQAQAASLVADCNGTRDGIYDIVNRAALLAMASNLHWIVLERGIRTAYEGALSWNGPGDACKTAEAVHE